MSATRRAWTIVGLVAAVLVLFGSLAGAACWAAHENRDGGVTFRIERGGSEYGEFQHPGGSQDGRSGPLPGFPGDGSRSGSDGYGNGSGDSFGGQGSPGGSQDGSQGGPRGQRGDRSSDGGTACPEPSGSGNS